MELKKLMEHISIIPDYRQAWKVEHENYFKFPLVRPE